MDAKYSEDDALEVVEYMSTILNDKPAAPGREVSNEYFKSISFISPSTLKTYLLYQAVRTRSK